VTPGNDVSFVAAAPEDLAATRNSYLEIELTATDSWGLSTVITQTLRPRLVRLTFATQPAGLLLTINDRTIVGPNTLISWANYELNVSAPGQIDGSGRRWQFAGWLDGAPADRTILTPLSTAIYTATFAPSQ
jgi:hypothetical protein